MRSFLAPLLGFGLHRPDPFAPKPILRDPEDDYLLALADAADAVLIVTGDKDLLDHPNLDPPAINARGVRTSRPALEIIGHLQTVSRNMSPSGQI